MNLFAEFRKLFPSDGVIVCSVLAENADGTTSANTLDNHPIRVMGVGGRAAGAKVFVQGGRIIGDAPNLTAFYQEV